MMDPRSDFSFSVGQTSQAIDALVPPRSQAIDALVPRIVRPACAFEPGAVIRPNPQGQWVCVNPAFLPEGKKLVPTCSAGTVPFLDNSETWSCAPLTPTGSPAPATGGGKKGASGALIIGALVLLGIGVVLITRS